MGSNPSTPAFLDSAFLDSATIVMTKEIIGNWKMNGLLSCEATFCEIMSGYAEYDSLSAERTREGARLTICPPSTLLYRFSSLARERDSRVLLGGQSCHHAAEGSFTGDISASMLHDCGAHRTLLGHAERRASGENDGMISRQLLAALHSGLTPILCVGENMDERSSGRTRIRLEEQLAGALLLVREMSISMPSLLIAYEPLWAIGSGELPSVDEISQAFECIMASVCDFSEERGSSSEISVLYGGSVTSKNAAAILDCSDGLLIGKASLESDELLSIVGLCYDSV